MGSGFVGNFIGDSSSETWTRGNPVLHQVGDHLDSSLLIITISCQIGLVHQFAPCDEAMKLGEVKLSLVNKEVFRQTLVLGLQMASHFLILATSVAALVL